MKDMTLIEWLIIFAVALILVALGVGFKLSSADFKKACDEARGTTVYDGRQYQCIKNAA